MRLEAMKKAREANEKKNSELEEKIHDSVFSAPFLATPKELPLSWEHNTQLIPGLSSIKGSAVRQWSVNQVAKFVSSLKGCLDQGKMFREQVSFRYWLLIVCLNGSQVVLQWMQFVVDICIKKM